LIQAFGEITEAGAVGDISERPAPYDHRYFTITLKGRFQALQHFLDKVENQPQLISIRKIDIRKMDEEAYMQATVWIGI
jgi:hypothetical protein